LGLAGVGLDSPLAFRDQEPHQRRAPETGSRPPDRPDPGLRVQGEQFFQVPPGLPLVLLQRWPEPLQQGGHQCGRPILSSLAPAHPPLEGLDLVAAGWAKSRKVLLGDLEDVIWMHVSPDCGQENLLGQMDVGQAALPVEVLPEGANIPQSQIRCKNEIAGVRCEGTPAEISPALTVGIDLVTDVSPLSPIRIDLMPHIPPIGSVRVHLRP
jgi:hypothetical protein